MSRWRRGEAPAHWIVRVTSAGVEVAVLDTHVHEQKLLRGGGARVADPVQRRRVGAGPTIDE
jgi:hypothetical protein